MNSVFDKLTPSKTKYDDLVAGQDVIKFVADGVGKCTFDQINQIACKMQYLLNNMSEDEFSHHRVNRRVNVHNFSILNMALEELMDIGYNGWRDNIDYGEEEENN